MATSQKAVAKWKKNNYKRIPLEVPHDWHESIKAAADLQGMSVNGFIKAAIQAYMKLCFDFDSGRHCCGGWRWEPKQIRNQIFKSVKEEFNMGNTITTFDVLVSYEHHIYGFNGHQIQRNVAGCLMVNARREDGVEAVINLTPDWKVQSIFVKY